MNISSLGAVTDLYFPEGLSGWEEWKSFQLESREEFSPVMILHSIDLPRLSFIVADPRKWDSSYEFDVEPGDIEALEALNKDELIPLSILTVEAEPFSVKANLLGPLVVNTRSGKGKQVIQSGRPYSAVQPIDKQIRPLNFSEGLAGYPEWQKFLLEKNDRIQPVKLLISQDIPKLSFPVVVPWVIDPEYKPKFEAEDIQALGMEDPAEAEWLVILDIRSEPLMVTANLLGPLAYNPTTGAARQVIQSQSNYPVALQLGGDLESVIQQFQVPSS